MQAMNSKDFNEKQQTSVYLTNILSYFFKYNSALCNEKTLLETNG